MIGQKVIKRTIPPVPPEFVENFLQDGWRRVERIYGARTDLILKWIEQSGGDELIAKRKAVLAKRREYIRGGGKAQSGKKGITI